MSQPNPPPASERPAPGQERGAAARAAAGVDDYRDILDAWYPSQASGERGTTVASAGRGDASTMPARPVARADRHR